MVNHCTIYSLNIDTIYWCSNDTVDYFIIFSNLRHLQAYLDAGFTSALSFNQSDNRCTFCAENALVSAPSTSANAQVDHVFVSSQYSDSIISAQVSCIVTNRWNVFHF